MIMQRPLLHSGVTSVTSEPVGGALPHPNILRSIALIRSVV
jgi:hypothetical protein